MTVSIPFQGQHTTIHHIDHGSSTLIIGFDHYRVKRNTHDIKLEIPFCERNNISYLRVIPRKNDWFLNSDFVPMLVALLEICGRYNEIRLIGYSMGGFGALMASGSLPIHSCLAISPQMQVTGESLNYDDRWYGIRKTLPSDYDHFDKLASVTGHVSIIYDPLNKNDLWHAKQILKYRPNYNMIDLKGGGHPAVGMLAKTNLFSKFNEEMLLGDASKKRVKALHRKAISRVIASEQEAI